MRLQSTLLALAVIIAGCASSSTSLTTDRNATTTGVVDVGGACPVTIPDGRFVPPDGYPPRPAVDEHV